MYDEVIKRGSAASGTFSLLHYSLFPHDPTLPNTFIKATSPKLSYKLQEEDMPRKPIKNRLPTRQFKRVERRLRGYKLTAYLVETTNSQDLKVRLETMENLCPCHLRKRVDAAWDAICRGHQDSNLNGYQVVSHTLEENHGGNQMPLSYIL